LIRQLVMEVELLGVVPLQGQILSPEEVVALMACSLGPGIPMAVTAFRGTYTNLWSSTPDGGNAWKRNLNVSNADVNRNTNNKANGFSVRCLKDWYKKACLCVSRTSRQNL